MNDDLLSEIKDLLDFKIDPLSNKIDALSERVGSLESRFDSLEFRVGSVESGLSGLQKEVREGFVGIGDLLTSMNNRNDKKFSDHERRLKKLELAK